MLTLLKHVVQSLFVKEPTKYSDFDKLNAEPKYRLISVKDADYYRIKALRDFSDVKKGDIGGYVSNLNNLSSYGNAWIYDNAKVLGFANVRDDAQVRDNALMVDQSELIGNAVLSGKAKLSGNASVRRHSTVCDLAHVSDNAVVSGNSRLSGSCVIKEYAYCYSSLVSGYVMLVRDAKVSSCRITGYSIIGSGWLKFKTV